MKLIKSVSAKSSKDIILEAYQKEVNSIRIETKVSDLIEASSKLLVAKIIKSPKIRSFMKDQGYVPEDIEDEIRVLVAKTMKEYLQVSW